MFVNLFRNWRPRKQKNPEPIDSYVVVGFQLQIRASNASGYSWKSKRKVDGEYFEFHLNTIRVY